MKIMFIRHGDPDYVHDCLTEKGKIEAELLADKLVKKEVTTFYCSPLGRARETAAVTLSRIGRTAEIYDWMQEFPGYILDLKTNEKRLPWDFLPAEWTMKDEYYHRDNWTKEANMSSGNVKEIYEGVEKGIDELLEKHGYIRSGRMYRCEQGNEDTIVIFCHLGVSFAMISHMLGISPVLLWHGFYVAPTAVTTLVTEERVKGEAYFRCTGFGDVSHLEARGETPSKAGLFREIAFDEAIG